MPIRKFRSFEELNQPIWRPAGSPELYRAIRAVWDFGMRTSNRRFRPGVYRFRSIEEMQNNEARIVSTAPPQK